MEWSQEDRSKAISYSAWKGKFCANCGTDPAEWLDEEGEGLEPPPYRAATRRCLGCATLEDARATLPKDVGQSVQTYLTRASLEDVLEWQMKPSVLE